MEKIAPGSKVGIISPSSALQDPDSISLGLDYLRSLGLTPVTGHHVFDKWRYMAGTDRNRADDINGFFADPDIKAVFCTCGGAGSQRLLPFLDYGLIRSNPKPVFGISDATALQLGIYALTGNINYTGFALKYDFKNGGVDGLVDATLRGILSGGNVHASGGETVIGGKAEGKLVGGCLSLMCNLTGTPYFPDLTDSILLIEDVDEKTYKIDLMLSHLSQLPGFFKIKGIIFGKFADTVQVDEADGSVDEIIDYFCRDLKIPVIKNFNYGHIPSRYILPVGGHVSLDADKGSVSF